MSRWAWGIANSIWSICSVCAWVPVSAFWCVCMSSAIRQWVNIEIFYFFPEMRMFFGGCLLFAATLLGSRQLTKWMARWQIAPVISHSSLSPQCLRQAPLLREALSRLTAAGARKEGGAETKRAWAKCIVCLNPHGALSGLNVFACCQVQQACQVDETSGRTLDKLLL